MEPNTTDFSRHHSLSCTCRTMAGAQGAMHKGVGAGEQGEGRDGLCHHQWACHHFIVLLLSNNPVKQLHPPQRPSPSNTAPSKGDMLASP